MRGTLLKLYVNIPTQITYYNSNVRALYHVICKKNNNIHV
jgi:hypothetical protein